MTEVASYRDVAWLYRCAGWRGVIPLPAGRKGPPPVGRTGWAGVAPSGADIQAWCDGPEGAGNIALSPREDEAGPGVEIIGVDVDAYAGKSGAVALERLTERAGVPLPATWVSTARDDGVSGIRFFRAALPPGQVWIDQPGGTGAGIEMIHRGHRYAVVWPSVNPDAGGAQYRWCLQSDMDSVLHDAESILGQSGELPRVDELPVLPDAWVSVLSRDGEPALGDAAGHADTLAAVERWRTGDACGAVLAARTAAWGALTPGRVSGEALHPTANGHIWELVRLGFESHRGSRDALAVHHGLFVAARGDVRGEGRELAEAEWWRMVRGAVGKALHAGLTVGETCSCEGALFDPGPPPLGPGSVNDPLTEVLASHGAEQARERLPGTDVESGSVPSEGGAGDMVDRLIAAMLSPAQMRARPAPPPLVAGMLALDSVAWLVAAPGSYKSFVALHLAACVAGGLPWLTRRTHTGPVVYVAAEGAGGMSLRVAAWETRYGPMSGPERDGVRILPMPVQAADPRQWGALVEACRRLRPALVVLDTQARVTVGLRENDNTDMGQFIEAAETLRRASGACVLIVHHTTKDGGGLRGAGALVGAASTVLELTKKDTGKAILRIGKQKDMSDDDEFALTLERIPLGVDAATGDPLSSLVVAGGENSRVVRWQPDWLANLTLNQAMIIGVVADLFPEHGATKSEVKSEVRSRRRPDGVFMANSSFNRAWDSLIGDARKLLRVKGTQRYVLASLHSTLDAPGDAADAPPPSPSDVLSALSERLDALEVTHDEE